MRPVRTWRSIRTRRVTASEVWQNQRPICQLDRLCWRMLAAKGKSRQQQRTDQALIVLSWPNWLIRSTLESKDRPQRGGRFCRGRLTTSYFLYSKISPGWHSRALQTASRVDRRIAFTLPFFNTEILANVMPTLSASSVTLIFRFANMTSMLMMIAMLVSLHR